MFISCVMLQMAQIVLFMTSVALDSPHIYKNPPKKTGTMQQISAGVCMVRMQQGMMIFI